MIYIINEIRRIFNVKKYKPVKKVIPKKESDRPNFKEESELANKGKIIDIKV